MSGGDKAFEKELIDIIKREFPVEKEIYLKNINCSNFKSAASNVHKLKHKISILGLEKSYEVAVSHESKLVNGSAEGHQAFELILRHMTDFLKTI